MKKELIFVDKKGNVHTPDTLAKMTDEEYLKWLDEQCGKVEFNLGYPDDALIYEDDKTTN